MPAGSDKLTDAEVGALRALVDRDGLRAASKALQVSREPLTRVLAGLPVHRGTVLAIRSALAGVGP